MPKFQTHFRHFPAKLLFLAILLLPWYDYLRFQIASIPFTAPEILIWLAAALWLGQVLIYHQQPAKLPASWLWISLAWLVIGSLSLLWSNQLTAALGIWKAYIVLPVISAYLAYQFIQTTRVTSTKLLQVLYLSAMQVALLCLSQWLIGWPNLNPHELSLGRSTAMFNSANAVGLYLAPLLLLATAQVAHSYRQGWFRQWVALILIGLGLPAMLTIDSQGAWAGLVVGLVALVGLSWLMPRLSRLKPIIWPSVIALCLVAYTATTLIFIARFNHPPQVDNPYTRPNFSTMTIRQCLWQGTWQALQAQPLTGFGLASFSEVYFKHHTCDAERLVYPHNLILNFWVELGLMGVIAALLMVGKVLITKPSHSQQSWLVIGLQAAFIYWLIHGLVDVPYFKNDLSVLWWLLIALLAANSHSNLKTQENNPSQSKA